MANHRDCSSDVYLSVYLCEWNPVKMKGSIGKHQHKYQASQVPIMFANTVAVWPQDQSFALKKFWSKVTVNSNLSTTFVRVSDSFEFTCALFVHKTFQVLSVCLLLTFHTCGEWRPFCISGQPKLMCTGCPSTFNTLEKIGLACGGKTAMPHSAVRVDIPGILYDFENWKQCIMVVAQANCDATIACKRSVNLCKSNCQTK